VVDERVGVLTSRCAASAAAGLQLFPAATCLCVRECLQVAAAECARADKGNV